ncbi:hypothetical protein EMIT0111MI5_10099 [Burkholderia sp. IT-111MI5]
MSARIAPASPLHKARRPARTAIRHAAHDAPRCSEAQMWCAAALSPCDIAVRADGARCTPMRHRASPRAAPAFMHAVVAPRSRRASRRLARILLNVMHHTGNGAGGQFPQTMPVIHGGPVRTTASLPCAARPDAGLFLPPAAAAQKNALSTAASTRHWNTT